MLMDLMDQMDRMAKMGAPRDTPRVCCAVGRWGAWADLPQGYAGNDGNGGVQTAGVWRG